MERRQSPRLRAELTAYVRAPGRSRCRCEVVNLSKGGALIAWQSDTLPTSPQIELVVLRDVGKVVRTFHCRAVVLRRSGNQLGLKFVRQPFGVRGRRAAGT